MESAPAAWVRWVMPSAADLIFIALLAVLVFSPLSMRLLGDAGIGWHIRTGQQILSAHAIPHTDPFSSTMAGKPWFAWEWLYDGVAAKLEAAAGLNGVTWLTAVVIGLVFALLFYFLIVRGTNLPVALVLTLLAMSASTIHFLARPHVMSWLFALAWFWILDSHECGKISSRWLWMLPVSMLVWVQVHGGFPLGFALLAIFWFGSFWTWLRLHEFRIEDSLEKIVAGKRARQLVWAAALSALASLLNPYGWKLHLHIWSYLSDRFLMDHIEEFQSPNFHGLAQRCFLILLLISIAAIVVRCRRLRLSIGLLALFAVYVGLYSSRNIPISSLILVMIVGPLLSGASGGGRFLERMTAVEFSLRGHLWPVLATVLTFLIAANGGRVGSDQWMDAHFDPQRMPAGAVTFLGTREGGHILSPDYWGGYVVYRLYPESRVVVDDRHDLYGSEFLQSYLNMVHVEQGWDEFIQRYSPSYVLLPRHSALANILSAAAGWRPIYADDVAIVFINDRANSNRAKMRK